MGVVVMEQLRSILIAGTNRLHLGLEQCRVFLGGVQPVATAMGLQGRLPQVAADLSRGNGSDNPTADHFIGQFRNSPVGDGSVGLLRRFASNRQDERDLFGGERAGTTGSWLIAEEFLDGVTQLGRCLQAFNAKQLGEGDLPAPPPKSDLVTFEPDLAGDGAVVQSRESQQDDGGTLHQTLGYSAGPAERLKDCL